LRAVRLKLAAWACINRVARQRDQRLKIRVFRWAMDLPSYMLRRRIESPRESP
jgi:hypothetical protein